jgi:hypothetical protein
MKIACLLVASAVLVLASPASASSATTWSPTDTAIGATSGPDATPKSEVMVAIDSTNPSRVIAGSIDTDTQPGPPCCTRGWWHMAIHTSADGGATWTDRGAAVPVGNDGQPLPCASAVGADPAVVFDRHGTAYYSYLSYAGDPLESCPADWTLAVMTSTDGGATWSAPVVVDKGDPPGVCVPDRDSLAYDPSSDAVYVAYARLCDTNDQIWFSKTTDAGTTWTAPSLVSTSLGEEAYGASPRVGPDGSLYVAYYRPAPFDGCPFLIGTTTGELVSAETVVAVSHDGGSTWTRTVAGAVCDNEYQVPEQPFNGAADFSWPSLAVDPVTGIAAVGWSNRDRPFSTVHIATSTDGGATWSAPVAVGDTGRSAFMPALVAAGGVLRLHYMSMSPSGLYDEIYRESVDGAAWSAPFVLNSAMLCGCWGSLNASYVDGGDLGHYIGLDAQAGRIVAAWPDNRDPTKVQTIYGRSGAY